MSHHRKPPPIVVNVGGGTNSTALMIGMIERGLAWDLSVFADTGGERPETYAHLDALDAWLSSVGMSRVVRVQWVRVKGPFAGKFISLEANCLRKKELPSRSYGLSGCSTKWKRQPVDRYVRSWQPAIDCWESGGKVTRLLGFDADEPARWGIARDCARWHYEYPLVEWGWGRRQCVEAIERAGMDQPGKSACFFCPSMTKNEIRRLGQEHPELLKRALEIERRAMPNVESRGGLGGHLNWAIFVDEDRRQGRLDLIDGDSEPVDGCPACFDGEA